MQGRRNPFIAREGIVFVLLSVVLGWLSVRYRQPWGFAASVALFGLSYLVFRDPRRRIPAVPDGVVSPVDGFVEDVSTSDSGVMHGSAHRIRIRVDSLGTYTARSPVEGKVMNLSSLAAESDADYRTNALWVQTDEGDDVVLQFDGFRFGLAPRSLTRYGERLGQGERCAYLRLARVAEVHLPIDSKVLVEPGHRVVAGLDLLGKLKMD